MPEKRMRESACTNCSPPLSFPLSVSTVTIKLQLKLLPALVCARKYATRFLFKYHSIFKSNPDASVFCALALFLFAVFCFLCVPPFFFCVACTLHSPLWCSAFNFHLVYFNVIFNSSVFSRALLARPRFVLQASVAGPPPRSIVMLVLVPVCACNSSCSSLSRVPRERRRFAPCAAREVALIRTFKPY